MRTPKYQVFVSSTFKNMERARQAAMAGVHDCLHIPITLENFAPESTSDLDVIEREVQESQVYVLILGPTYGAIPPGRDKSYTHIEYELAEEAGREIMIFLLEWEDVLSRRQERKPTRPPEEEERALERLASFYEQLRSGKHFCRTWAWDRPESIRRFVLMRLKDLPGEPNAPRGLVLEPDFDQELVDSVAKNEFLMDTVAAIRGFDKLYQRTTGNVPAKQRAAAFLAQRYHARMADAETRGIFFESGSSVAFVAKQLPESLWQRVRFGAAGEPKKRISTNNVLVYLHLWLSERVPCAQFPWGPPEGTYGASYGPIDLLDPRDPNYKGRPLNTRAKQAIRSLGESRLALRPENTSLIVTAASGLQLSSDHKIVTDPDFELPASVHDAVDSCFGPHVGSYKNKVFKRYLYETGLPALLIVDSSKIDCPIDVRKCHFIFDRELTWKSILAEHPLAFCLGCPAEELDDISKDLRKKLSGFEIVTTEQTRPFSALIARNQAFKDAFKEETTGLGTQ